MATCFEYEREKVLVERAAAGDTAAFDVLYLAYFDKLVGYFYHKLHECREAAEDAAQTVLLRMLVCIKSFEYRDVTFEAWLFTVAHRHLIDINRKSDTLHLSMEYPIPDSDPTPEEVVVQRISRDDAKQQVRAILEHECLKKSNPLYSRVLYMRDIEGMEYDDMGRLLGKEPNTLRVTHHRAISKIRKAVAC